MATTGTFYYKRSRDMTVRIRRISLKDERRQAQREGWRYVTSREVGALRKKLRETGYAIINVVEEVQS